jgi:hypothetical protein
MSQYLPILHEEDEDEEDGDADGDVAVMNTTINSQDSRSISHKQLDDLLADVAPRLDDSMSIGSSVNEFHTFDRMKNYGRNTEYNDSDEEDESRINYTQSNAASPAVPQLPAIPEIDDHYNSSDEEGDEKGRTPRGVVPPADSMDSSDEDIRRLNSIHMSNEDDHPLSDSINLRRLQSIHSNSSRMENESQMNVAPHDAEENDQMSAVYATSSAVFGESQSIDAPQMEAADDSVKKKKISSLKSTVSFADPVGMGESDDQLTQ